MTDAKQHSSQLTHILRQRMVDGPLSFHDFMQACLYEPGLGYYVAGAPKFGEEGDFVTAPMLGPLFAHTLFQATYPVIQSTQGNYLELGAGMGDLAYGILSALRKGGDTTTRYYILEVSPDCRHQQALKLAEFGEQVVWLNTLPRDFKGVLLANEVLDALPVHLFHYKAGELFERCVTWQNDKFAWKDVEPTDPLFIKACEALPLTSNMKEDYLSELNPTLPMFIRSLCEVLKAGQLVFIDYGFLDDEYYHPDRHQGTLMCHHQHTTHPDPLIHVGLQDITAHVNFSVVGETAQQAGFQVAYYTQAEYLLANGLLDVLQTMTENADARNRLMLSQQVQKLTMPHEMGEIFKVMVLDR